MFVKQLFVKQILQVFLLFAKIYIYIFNRILCSINKILIA